MVSVTIMGVMVSIAVPAYDRQVLKGRFEEAKVTIQAIALAQERYKIEVGTYYPNTNVTVHNENLIFENLKVDLSKSNNFVYAITGYGYGLNYEVTAILRKSSWTTNCNNNENKWCKQDDYYSNAAVADADDWVAQYNTNKTNHYIRFEYPNLIQVDESNNIFDVVNGIDYTNIYKGDE